jgi:amidohydrolase
MTLTNSDIIDLIALRHDLHRHPEVSGHEAQTAQRIVEAFDPLSPDQIMTDLGGHGVAAVFDGLEAGPTVLFRCELDALPIFETGTPAHRSLIEGVGHLCGHDGHMAILMGLARLLSRQRPKRGRVVLLFQPAEETGAGAKAVLEDEQYDPIQPQYAFALHNTPGLPIGHVALNSGPVTCASRGLEAQFIGRSAHASQPETGISPMAALAQVMPELTKLSHGSTEDPDFALVTVTHAQMGEPAFGIAPGDARLFATLRTLTDDLMSNLCDQALTMLNTACDAHGLTFTHAYHDIFLHSENDAKATAIATAALDALKIPHDATGLPWRPSEDFGRFGHSARAAMLFLGAGHGHAALHNPDYDFPDDLIPIGTSIFHRIARDLLG